MRAAIFKATGKVEIEERSDPTILAPSDAIVRVGLACVCGSDLWYYRGETEYQPGSPIVDGDINDELDAAYRAKYGNYSGPVAAITSPLARSTTLKLVPRSSVC